jgi:soluble lytic murein transglycosylase
MSSGLFKVPFLFLIFSLYASSCTMPQVQSDFYRGLSAKGSSDDTNDAVRFFEKALLSQNDFIRQAAAEEIANLVVEESAEISSLTAEWVRLGVTGYWARAFAAVEPVPDKDKALDVLLGFEQGEAFPDAARVYVQNECEKLENFFSDTEDAAVQGHYLITRQRYGEALTFFRNFQENNQWPARLPDLFVKYPVLISDLGRAFQFTNSSGTEGLTLFLRWEENLGSTVSEDALDDVRYRLLFYAGRIARRAAQAERAVSLFERALSLVPDYEEQQDACIWYALDTTLRENQDNFIEQLEKFAPLWNSGRYFDDVMERYLQVLNAGKEWENLIRAYDAIKESGGPFARAGYAWVIARLIEEGSLSADELRLAAKAANATAADSRAYVWFAYNGADKQILSALYYRHLGAEKLERPFLEMNGPASVHENPSQVMQFLLGFFSHHAAEYAVPYIRRFEKDLSPGELRVLAEALHRAGQYAPSIRLVSLYINNDDYVHNRHDLELLFPRPHRDLVERYAKEFHIEPALLFALIRTESAFQHAVVSRAGAVGLTQLMPATAREMAQRIRRGGGPDYTAGGLDLSDPSLNIHMGAYYYNFLYQRFNNTLLSLFAYNGGMGRVSRWRNASTLPDDLFMETITIAETRDYGRKVLAAMAAYEDLYYRRGH